MILIMELAIINLTNVNLFILTSPTAPPESPDGFAWRLGLSFPGKMKRLRESEAGGVNSSRCISSISHQRSCLGRLLPPPFPPRIIKMLSRIKKYNAVYGRTINTASKLITFPLQRVIYFAVLGASVEPFAFIAILLVDE